MIQDFMENKIPGIQAPNVEHFEHHIQHKTISENTRIILQQTLREQYDKIENKTIVLDQINSLSEPNTFTVTTGHQCCLFTGPLYFVYKILSTIKLAQTLTVKFPRHKFVPLLWMATEDHDFDEISSFRVENKNFVWPMKTELQPVGRLITQLQNLHTELDKNIPHLPYKTELLELFDKAYCHGHSLSEATRILVHKLFGASGLIILDADHPHLKRILIPVIEEDIFMQSTNDLVVKRNNTLTAKGYKIQVNPREINFFYIGSSGRQRVINTTDGFATADKKNLWTTADLKAEIKNHPERFSPNVLLRPIYQETILPNLAYVGGPGELAYWMQLPEVFAHNHVDFPQLVLRNSGLIVTQAAQKLLSQLELNLEVLSMDKETAKRIWIKNQTSELPPLSKYQKDLDVLYQSLMPAVIRLDITLEKSCLSALHKSRKILENLERKWLQAAMRKEEINMSRFDRLYELLQPGGISQERIENFAIYYSRWGDKFIKEMEGAFKLYGMELTILEE